MAEDIKRRDFLKLVSLGGAATVLSNCAQPVEKVIPYLIKEEDVTPGVSTYFATVCRECPAGCGMIVRTREGRALKAEGNPEHPVNAGKLCTRGQASMQGLYNPDRFRQAMRVASGSFSPVGWDEAVDEVAGKIAAAKASGKANSVAYVGGLNTGTFDTLVGDFLNVSGSNSRFVYEPLAYDALRSAAKQTFGIDAVPAFDFSKAKMIVSFGADFLETWLSPIEYARQFALQHSYKDGKMGSFVYVGPRLSVTAANADRWLGIKPGQELAVALAVLNVVISQGLAKNDVSAVRSVVADYTPEKVATVAGIEAEAITKLARDFAAGPTLAVGGSNVANGAALSAVVNLLNYAVGNVGQTVQFGPNQTQGAATNNLDALIDRMQKGEIQVLVLNDVNPAFSLPASAKWAEAVAKVPYVAYLSSYPSETASQANIVLALHSPYEQWGDYTPREGVYGLMQPAMRPIFDTRHPGDILLAVMRKVQAGAGGSGDYEQFLRTAWAARHTEFGAGKSFDVFFNDALQHGGVFKTAAAASVKLAAEAANIDVKAPAVEGAALVAYPTIQFFDGRMANRPWLQELPDAMTKIVWNSWVEVNPATAAKLGVVNGDILKVTTPMGEVEAPAYVYRGVREDVFAIPVGQGHSTAFGRYAAELHSDKGDLVSGTGMRGVNPLAIVPSASLVSSVTIAKTGRKEPLAIMQGSDSQEDRGIAQVIPLSQVAMLAQKAAKQTAEGRERAEKDPEHPKRAWEVGTIENRVMGQRGEEPGPNFYVPHDHPDHRWGMSINLSSCIGCGACTIACYAENNVPVVGPELMLKGREMAWIWIERYFDEKPGESPESRFVPMLCQQCDNAPCETVCPVYATYHNSEGLNAQVYNRCVGTRYCGNNCPYKVRRFNWFNYEWPAPLHMQLNPDVSVRTKGVMEKCTFCVQRIREAKDIARDENRKVRDGDVTPACAQTCPTDAIVFGDLKDPGSRVSQLNLDPRGYRVLEDLNTQSAITYMAEVVNEQES